MGAIERLIHQKKFESEHQKAVISLIYLANAVTANNNEILKPYKITLQQYNVLRILRGNRNNVSSVHYIKDRLLDNNSDASRLIDRLVKLNFAERKICSEDRRSADIRINEKGMNLLAEIDNEIKREFEPLAKLSKQELAQLNELLDKVLESL